MAQQRENLKSFLRISSKRQKTTSYCIVEVVSGRSISEQSINGPLLKEKVDDFAKKFKRDEFLCSGGWLDRLKARHGIVFLGVCGEAAAVDQDVVTT